MPSNQFSGFHPTLFQFLDDLAAHNNRDWFAQHKARYESDVLAPALQFVEAMRKPLAGISPHLLAVPKRVGGSIMRVYRDTRFSNDKTPYKTNVGIHFRHEKCKDVHAPGYYLHLATDECFLGCGIWHPDAKALTGIRKTIDKDQAGWKRASRGKAFQGDFRLAGETLKRPPKGYDADHPLIEDLKRKDFIAVAELDLDELFDPRLVKTVTAKLRLGKPLMKFLCGATQLAF